ncbi:DUF3298 and DUF4163 domain-containing protein [Oceanirhabdus sp. W0125-5]|uniref:DUF3298 and DUF4163 domain-containing protein n=1 Tax=Oceanirhabdus sp. W0125-5 TaxID=2999116 RepID=UPI0022F2DFD0|nr:DUF3298 and DUF4163 domain-containing protein [Oceanirhabdus sp. W0125-5]WBW97634.1 DUF3298 and DUF4163 domain-containing protein [Oceanirhabdus sp. W0125-5]
MNLKKTLIFLSFLIFTLCNIVFAISPITIKTKEVKYKTNYFKSNLKIPVVTGLTDQSLQDTINKKFDIQAKVLKDDIETLAKRYYDEAKKEGLTITPYIVSTDYEIKLNNESMLCILMGFYEYTGGAHGNYYYNSTTVDLSKDKDVTLSSLFKENFDYKDIVIKKIHKDIELDPESYFKNAKSLINNICDDTKFYIEKDNLVVYYDLYEIAPYSTGIPEFKIPLKSFSTGYVYN